MFTKRQIEILELILKNYTGITGSNIAEILNVSSRTIRSDIAKINQEFKNKNYKISSSRINGYFIDTKIIDELKEIVFSKKIATVSYDESDDRVFKILSTVLFEGKKSILDLADDLFISEQTLYKECNKLKKLLEEKYSYNFLEVSGEYIINTAQESQSRELIFKLLKESVLSNKVTYIKDFQRLFNNNFDDNEYKLLYLKIKKFLAKRDSVIDDKSLDIIVGAIYMSVVRNRKGLHVSELNEDIKNKYHEIISWLISELNSSGFDLSKSDMNCLGKFLWSIKIYKDDKEVSSISNVTASVVSEFCTDVMDKYSFDLKESKEVIDYLMTHTEYMIRRLATGFELNNPMLEDIKIKYAFAYEIAMLIVPILYKYKNKYAADDEISYIAVYVQYYLDNINSKLKTVIITDSSMGMNNIVRSWLNNNFVNQLEVVDYITLHSLKNYLEENDIDLIVSVRELATDLAIPSYIIENIPDKNDHNLLSKVIHKIKVSQRYKNIVKRMFSEKYINFYDGSQSFEEIIIDMSKTLEKNNCIENAREFSKDVIEREKYYPTTMGKRFAIPHPLAVFANKTTVSVAIMEKPIPHNKKELKLIFLLAIENKMDDDVNTLFQVLKQIAIDKNGLRELTDINCKKKFLTNLIDLLSNK